MEQGFFTLDALAGLLILAVMLPILASVWNIGVVSLRKRAVAEHFTAVEKAAHEYGKLYHATLLPQTTAVSGPSLTLAQLKAADCLPDRFTETNAWGQGYQITSRKDSTDALAMVVLTTGGRGHSAKDPDFANIQVPETAALARAGFIPTGLLGASNVLRGAYGSWQVSLASFGLAGTPGHLGSISSFSASDLAQDFLYRVPIPGEPGLNAMAVDLDMTGHGISGVRDLAYVPQDFEDVGGFCLTAADEGKTFLDPARGMYLCRNGGIVLLNDTGNSLMAQAALLARNDQLIDKPVCPPGSGLRPEILVTPSILSSGAETPPMAALQAWAVSFSDSQWQVKLRVLTTDDAWVYPAPDYGRMVVMTTCARDI
jgi:hypothetical protein